MKLPNRVLDSMRVGVAGAGILLAMGCQQPDPSRDLTPVVTNTPASEAPAAVAAVPAPPAVAPAPVATPPAPVVTPPAPVATPSTPTSAPASEPTPEQLLAQKRAQRAAEARARQIAARNAFMNRQMYVACGMG